MAEYSSAGLAALLVPQANTTVEAEMAVLLPPGCGSMTARLTSGATDSQERLLGYFERVDATLDTLGGAKPGVALFACTGSTYLVGRDAERERFEIVGRQRGYPLVSAAEAIEAALKELGAERIALVSPYPDWLTAACAGFWRGRGRDVVSVTTVGTPGADTRAIYSLGTAAALAALQGADLAHGQAVVLTGTGMPTLGTIASAPSSVPVLSSNLCLAWKAAQVLGHPLSSRVRWLGPGAWWHDTLATRFPDTIAK